MANIATKSIKGTKTEQALLAAFAGESQARNRYTYFAGAAKKAGYEQIAAIFLETEWTKLYKDAGKIAREEGFEEVAKQFKEISEVEEQHEKRYRKLLQNIKDNKVFSSDRVVKWHCRNCGYVHEGKEAPESCPACAHPQSYYEILAENY